MLSELKFFRVAVASLFSLSILCAPVLAEHGIEQASQPEAGSLWVSKDQARGHAGEIRFESFSERDRERVRSLLESAARWEREGHRSEVTGRSGKPRPNLPSTGDPETPCIGFATRSEPAWDYQPVNSFESLTRNAAAIAGGRVERIEEGFFAGVPRSLLVLSEPIVVKRGPRFGLSTPLVVYPEAAFVLQGTAFCSHDASFPPRPKVGDRVLVYQQLPPRDLAGNVLEPWGHGLFIDSPGHELIVPPQLRDDPQLQGLDTLERVIDRSRQLLDEESGRGESP